MTTYLTGSNLREKTILMLLLYNGYVIPTLYYGYVILILILTLSFVFNQILNNYLFRLSYKAIVYFTIL